MKKSPFHMVWNEILELQINNEASASGRILEIIKTSTTPKDVLLHYIIIYLSLNTSIRRIAVTHWKK